MASIGPAVGRPQASRRGPGGVVGLLGIKDTPGDRPRRQGQRGRNVGSIPKREAAGFDKRGDRSNGSVGRFSGKIEPLSLKFL